jgi:putative ABC transport system ATP-binding protein
VTGVDAPRAPVLEARGLHRFFFKGEESEVAALKDVSFLVNVGEFIAVVGPSGSGKSTLLNLVAGLDNPDGGTVLINGERLSHRDAGALAMIRGCAIGVLTQTSGLIDHLSVVGNVHLAARLRRRARRSGLARSLHFDDQGTRPSPLDSHQLLAAVGLANRMHARPSTLSGGETARANLAVALAGGPSVLLADEPTAEISRGEEQAVLDLLDSVRPPDGVTVVVTHSAVVARRADRVIELVDGRRR